MHLVGFIIRIFTVIKVANYDGHEARIRNKELHQLYQLQPFYGVGSNLYMIM